MQKLPFIIFLCLLSLPLSGQGLRFEYYTMEDGLSSQRGLTSQNCIIQDREGFIWIASFNGINRLDGQSIKVFNYNPEDPGSIGDNIIATLCEDDEGRIWAGGGDGDIYIFDPATETFKTLEQDPAKPETHYGQGLNTLAKDREGNIWILTRFHGVSRWNKDTQTLTSFREYLRDGIAFLEDSNGDIWIGNFEGLHRKVRNEDQFVRIEHQSGSPGGPLGPVRSICELPGGDLLLTSPNKKIWRLDPQSNIYQEFSGFRTSLRESPNFVMTDKWQQVWMTSYKEIQQYDAFSNEVKVFPYEEDQPGSGSPFDLMYAFQDKAGSMWIMTTGAGIQVTHNLDSPFEHIQNKPGYIFQKFSDSLMLSAYNGIEAFNVFTKTVVDIGLPEEIAKMSPTEMTLSGSELFVTEWRENVRKMRSFNLETKKSKVIPFNSGTGLYTDQKGNVWCGLSCFDPVKNEWIDRSNEISRSFPEYTENTRIHDLYFDENNILWIASNEGIYAYYLEGGKNRHYAFSPFEKGSLNSTFIFTFFRGSNGRFYATSSNGLNIYDPQRDGFLTYNSANGLLHDHPNFVVEDSRGDAWIGTSKGLQKLSWKDTTFTSYSKSDGLYSNELEIHFPAADQLGNIYFSQQGNILRFHPDSLQQDTFAAPVYLMDLFLYREKVPLDTSGQGPLSRLLRFEEEVRLNYDQSDFGFSFVMPTFKKSDQVEYFYQLYPYEKTWISAGNETAIHYTNIGSGTYEFRVKARTAAGFWSPNVASIKLVVATPWWKTPLAYAFYFLIILVILYGLRSYELNRQYQKTEALRLQELDGLKTRLYTNITHEFRTPLTVIMGIVDTIKDHEKEKQLLKRNSKNLLRLINQLLDLSKLDSGTMKMDMVQGDIIIYLQYLTESFHSMAEEKQILLHFHSEVPELVMDYDEVKMQHIVYNLLSNAIKFTETGGEVSVHIKTEKLKGNQLLSILVRDTGVGMAASDLAHIFDRFYQVDSPHSRKGEGTGIGLALTKEMVELMGGEIAARSQPGKGTEMTLLIPVVKDTLTPMQELNFFTSSSLVPEFYVNGHLEENLIEEKNSNEPFPFNGNEKAKLLLIEDNKDVATYIQTILNNHYEIFLARNGQEGIDQALETIPDIIISDVMMPEKDGFEVCTTLKNDERSSHIPIILLTAKAMEKDKITGLRVGADAYLKKPFNKEELLVRLEKLVLLRKKLQEKYSGNIIEKPLPNKAPTLDDLFLEKLRQAVESHLGDPHFKVSDLCQTANLSHVQVFRKLKALTDLSPSLFIRQIRLYKAKEMLQNTDLNVSEIAYEVGFADPNYFSRTFSETFGVPPSEMRE